MELESETESEKPKASYVSLFLAIRLLFRYTFIHLIFLIQISFVKIFSLEPLESLESSE